MKQLRLYWIAGLLAVLSGGWMQAQEAPSTIVTTVNDIVNPSDNLISLREAIGYAGGPLGRTITFNLPEGSGNRIELISALPTFTAVYTIDGTNLGPDGGVVTISGNDMHRPFVVNNTSLTLKNLRLCHGVGDDGGMIKITDGTLAITDCSLDSNYANSGNGKGGAIYAIGSNLTLNNCALSGNYCEVGGGACYTDNTAGSASFNHCSFYNNQAGTTYASATGGALYLTNYGKRLINNCTFIDNHSLGDGGAYCDCPSLTNYSIILNSTFVDNHSLSYGNALRIHSDLLIANNILLNNDLVGTDNGHSIWAYYNILSQPNCNHIASVGNTTNAQTTEQIICVGGVPRPYNETVRGVTHRYYRPIEGSQTDLNGRKIGITANGIVGIFLINNWYDMVANSTSSATFVADTLDMVGNSRLCREPQHYSAGAITRPRAIFYDTVIACDRYPWNGRFYYADGDYQHYSSHAHYALCDTMDHLHLHLGYTDTVHISDSVCDYYIWDGIRYEEEGTYTHHYLSVEGCDSVVEMTLSMHGTLSSTEEILSCDSYTWLEKQRAITQSGTYIDTLHTVGGCDSIVTLHVTIGNSKYEEYSADICQGDEYPFGREKLSHTGTYTHSETGRNGCDSVAVLFLNVLDKLDATFSDSSDCPTEAWYLKALADAPYMRWTVDEEVIDVDENDNYLVVRPKRESTYTLLVDYTDSGTCPQRYSKTLLPLHNVTVEIETTLPYLTYENREFKAIAQQRGAKTLHWWINGWESGENFIVYKADESIDSLLVKLYASNETCADSDTVVLRLYKSQLFVPNSFTPNEMLNNRFGAIYRDVLDFEMWIYNRQGLLMFHTTDINEGWDGTHKGTPCTQGAYVYMIRYRDRNLPNSDQHKKGTVTLIR